MTLEVSPLLLVSSPWPLPFSPLSSQFVPLSSLVLNCLQVLIIVVLCDICYLRLWVTVAAQTEAESLRLSHELSRFSNTPDGEP